MLNLSDCICHISGAGTKTVLNSQVFFHVTVSGVAWMESKCRPNSRGVFVDPRMLIGAFWRIFGTNKNVL